MKVYPINFDIENKPCVVIGGGEVALRKIYGLLEAGGRVKVIAPEICAGIEELYLRGKITLIREKFSEEILGDEVILIAATNDIKVNERVARAAQEKKILVNVASGRGGNFFVPSKILRGELLLTISTGANSPALARFIRRMLELELGENFGASLELISRKRREVKKILPAPDIRRIFWRNFLTSEIWELLKLGELGELEERINYALKNFGLESHDGTD